MANVIYPLFKKALLSGSVNMFTADVRVMLVKQAQGYNAADEFVADFTGSNIVQRTTADLTTKSISDLAVFDADDVTFTAVTNGDTVVVVIFIHDGGTDASRRLVAWIDTGTNIPRITDGDDVPVVWSNSAERIFKL